MISGGLVYLVGTVLRYAGLFLILRVLYQATLGFTLPPGYIQRNNLMKSTTVNGVAAIVSLIFSFPLLTSSIQGLRPPNPTTGAVNLPLIWFVMPFTLWCIIASIIFIVIGMLRLAVEQTSAARKNRALAILLWVLFGGICTYYFLTDSSRSVKVFSGYVPISWTLAILFIALAIVSVVAMSLTEKSFRTRGYAKIVATHIALLVGSVVFGIPFAWLVITSFKEDIDMSSPNGIVWIPKVQDTISYLAPLTSPPRFFGVENKEPFVGQIVKKLGNGMVLVQPREMPGRGSGTFIVKESSLSPIPPPDPNYEGNQDGVDFVGDIQSKNPDGTVTINVIHPQSIAGETFIMRIDHLKQVPIPAKIVTVSVASTIVTAAILDANTNGTDYIKILSPSKFKDVEAIVLAKDTTPLRHVGLRYQNYPDALDFLPVRTHYGLTYLENTLILVILNVFGTILSSSIVAYAFSRMRFPGKNFLFIVVLSTMMLPGAVTLLPQFLIFKSLGWINTLKPLWVPSFLASAFNIFLLRQFLSQVPMELEDAAKIDGCSYLKTFWAIMLPQIKPALAVIGIWTFMGAWNDFMGPLIYITSPEKMPISYALQLYNSDHGGQPGMLMAFTTLSMIPVLALFFFAQRYFIEGVQLSGLGGR